MGSGQIECQHHPHIISRKKSPMDLRFVVSTQRKGFSFYPSEFTWQIKSCKVKIVFTDCLIQFRKSGKSLLPFYNLYCVVANHERWTVQRPPGSLLNDLLILMGQAQTKRKFPKRLFTMCERLASAFILI